MTSLLITLAIISTVPPEALILGGSFVGGGATAGTIHFLVFRDLAQKIYEIHGKVQALEAHVDNIQKAINGRR